MAVDPWTPEQPQGVPQAIPTFPQIAAPPQSFMDDPRARAALLSFGIAASQPPSFADSGISQLTRALGAGGEAVGRVEDQQRKDAELGIKQDEASSKQDLRGAQADASVARAGAAEARASAAGDRSTMAGERLALTKQEMDNRKERGNLQARLRLTNLYSNYVKGVKKANEDGPLNQGKNFKPEPILDIDTWTKQNPMLKSLGLVPDEGTTASPDEIPPATSTAPAGTLTPTNLNSLPPRDPTQRKVGQVYSTHDGRNVRWDGTKFIEVQ